MAALRGFAGWVRAPPLGASLLPGAMGRRNRRVSLPVGGAGFLVTQAVVQEGQDDLWQVAAVSIAQPRCFLIAILLEGEGLRPIRDGIDALAQYDTGSVYDNLRCVVRRIGLPALGAMVALLLWGGHPMIPRLRRIHANLR